MATPLRILLADDDLKYSILLKRFLEKEGYEVTYTGNGTMALEQFPAVKPDLVLLDINMPGKNGFEVAEKIREQDHNVLIFFLSDRSDKNDRLKGFSVREMIIWLNPFIRKNCWHVSGNVLNKIYQWKQQKNYTLSEIRFSTMRQMKYVQVTVKR